MRSTTNLAAALLFTVALGGCAFGDGEETSSTEATASTEAALGIGNGFSTSSCSDGYCTCTGDADCNDMFSSGVCKEGPRTAICQINGYGVPRCRCVAAREVDDEDGPLVPRLPIGPILMAP